ncbi:hypothetical protein OEZ85_004184 [Tetradesmus obliquus]|uniref:SET domain-containing protein n=1 Tax=Tetradesmus obliquus TaxID=3088 RepID=A0ABY8UKZ2_TETOB|nr:hypothetical protein OEZ85_004184 [Tetradesmus obliquus]
MHPQVTARYKQDVADFMTELAARFASPAKPTRQAAQGRALASSAADLARLHVALDPPWGKPSDAGSTSAWCKEHGIKPAALQQQLVDMINAALADQPGGSTLGCANQLPEQLPCRHMAPYIIPDSHPVELLRGQQSVRFTADLTAGVILGPYSKPSRFTTGEPGRVVVAWEYLLWQLLVESYAVQDEGFNLPAVKRQPAAGSKGSKAARAQQASASSKAAAATSVAQDLFCSAFGYGNMTALVNDPTVSPLELCDDAAAYAGRSQVSPPNVVIRVLWVRRRPFPFMITSRPVAAGEDLWYDYGEAYWTIPKRLLATIDLATGMAPSQAFESAFKLCRGEGPEVAALVAALNGKEAMLPALQHVRGPAGVRQQLLDGTVGLAVRAGWCFLNSSMMQRQEKGISMRAAGVCSAAKPCRNIWGKALHSVAEELGCL